MAGPGYPGEKSEGPLRARGLQGIRGWWGRGGRGGWLRRLRPGLCRRLEWRCRSGLVQLVGGGGGRNGGRSLDRESLAG